MIRLPKGKMLLKSIDTTYVKLDGVLQNLHKEVFTGYVRLVAENAEAVLFLRDGELVAPVLEKEGKTVTGEEALLGILDLLKGARAFLDICKLDHDLLRSLLAIHHGTSRTLKADKAPADAAALAALLGTPGFTGVAALDPPAGALYAYAVDGTVIGAWWADEDRWTERIEPWRGEATRCELLSCIDAHAVRTVDLALQREEMLQTMVKDAERFIPEFGPYLLELECRRQSIGDARLMTKPEFYDLAEGLVRRARLLIGEKKAAVMRLAMRGEVARLIDAGI